MRTLLFRIIRLIVSCTYPIVWLRNMLMWPITSRLLGINYSTVITRNGYKIKIDLKDQLNRILRFFGTTVSNLWEPQTTKLAQQIVRNKQSIVVAGSHIGYINLELLRFLQPNATIYTFEPAAYLFKRAGENIALNSAEQKIKLFHAALSDTNGTGSMYVEDLRSSLIPYSRSHQVHNNTESVPTVTLDQFATTQQISHIDFLFLDVEGFELEVLTGAERLIAADKPTMILEVSHKIISDEKINKLFDLLKKYQYSVFLIEDNYSLDNPRAWDKKPFHVSPTQAHDPRLKAHGYANILVVQPGSNDAIYAK